MQNHMGVQNAAVKMIYSMKDCGFEIKSRVEIFVDEDLDFMGYTTRTDNGFRIVVSGFSVESGAFEGLLLHELSHIYRMESGHFSHDDIILTNALNHVAMKHKIRDKNKLQMLHQAVNHIQDLYADDIAFKVFTEKGLIEKDGMEKFFLEWVKDKPVKSNEAPEQKWVNASMMLNNAFAISNMERHGILNKEAVIKNKSFLSEIGKTAEKFGYFKNFMTGLDDDKDEEKFEKEIVDYLENFVSLVL